MNVCECCEEETDLVVVDQETGCRLCTECTEILIADLETDHACTGARCRECATHHAEEAYETERHSG